MHSDHHGEYSSQQKLHGMGRWLTRFQWLISDTLYRLAKGINVPHLWHFARKTYRWLPSQHVSIIVYNIFVKRTTEIQHMFMTSLSFFRYRAIFYTYVQDKKVHIVIALEEMGKGRWNKNKVRYQKDFVWGKYNHTFPRWRSHQFSLYGRSLVCGRWPTTGPIDVCYKCQYFRLVCYQVLPLRVIIRVLVHTPYAVVVTISI